MSIQVSIDLESIADFCRWHHIRSLSLFGSVLREDFTPDSDVDVLVEFEDGYTPGWEFFDLEDELSTILGRRIDLKNPGSSVGPSASACPIMHSSSMQPEDEALITDILESSREAVLPTVISALEPLLESAAENADST